MLLVVATNVHVYSLTLLPQILMNVLKTFPVAIILCVTTQLVPIHVLVIQDLLVMDLCVQV